MPVPYVRRVKEQMWPSIETVHNDNVCLLEALAAEVTGDIEGQTLGYRAPSPASIQRQLESISCVRACRNPHRVLLILAFTPGSKITYSLHLVWSQRTKLKSKLLMFGHTLEGAMYSKAANSVCSGLQKLSIICSRRAMGMVGKELK